MTTLWAIEVTPLNGIVKPWIDHTTVSCLRKDAWAKCRKDWLPDEFKRRQRKGLLRAVKVTIQIQVEKK